MKRMPGRIFTPLILAVIVANGGSFAWAEDSAFESAEKATVHELQKVSVAKSQTDKWDFAAELRPETLARLGRPDLAMATISQLWPKGDKYREGPMRDSVWDLTVRRLALRGDLAGARQAVGRIQNPKVRVNGLWTIARAELRAGRLTQALPELKAASGLVVSQKLKDEAAYTACLMAEAGDAAGSRSLFAIESKIPKSERWSMEGSGVFYRFRAGFGAENLRSVPQDPDLVKRLVGTAAAAGDYELALKVAQRVKSAPVRLGCLTDVGLRAVKKGRPEIAQRAAEMAERVGQNVDAEEVEGDGPEAESASSWELWRDLTLLQELLGRSGGRESLLRAERAARANYQAIKRASNQHEEALMPMNTTRGIRCTLATPEYLVCFSEEKRPQVLMAALEAASAMPPRLGFNSLHGLLDQSDREMKNMILTRMVEAARKLAAKAVTADDLRPLVEMARREKEIGEPEMSQTLLNEALAIMKKRFAVQANGVTLMYEGFIEDGLRLLAGKDWYDEYGAVLQQVAEYQSQCQAPAAPPNWILAIKGKDNREWALTGWAAGLEKISDPVLLAEEEEFVLLDSGFRRLLRPERIALRNSP